MQEILAVRLAEPKKKGTDSYAMQSNALHSKFKSSYSNPKPLQLFEILLHTTSHLARRPLATHSA